VVTLEATDLRDGYAELGEMRLHYVEAGDGPLVVLLHGFPEFWYGWRFQIPALAEAGFRVVAPDMRGYNLSSRPSGVRAYDMDLLAGDVRDLIYERGAE
jgi:pimeloyl-ACP methyl ester carboxylesterase